MNKTKQQVFLLNILFSKYILKLLNFKTKTKIGLSFGENKQSKFVPILKNNLKNYLKQR